MRVVLVWGIMVSAAIGALGQTGPQEKLYRDGAAQVRQLSGAVATTTAQTIEVKTQIGDIHFQPDNVVRYTIELRSTAPDAASRLERWPIAIEDDGEALTFATEAMPAAGASVKESLTVTIGVPAGMRVVTGTTELGAIYAERVAAPLRLTTNAGDIHADKLGAALQADSRTGDIAIGAAGAASASTAGHIDVEHATGTLRLVDRGGPVTVKQASGEVQITSYGGAIDIGRVDGALVADSRGGNIRLEQSAATARLHTDGGSIVVLDAGELHAMTGSGNIELQKVRGSVEAETGSGQIAASFAPDARMGSSRLTSGQGGITVSLPVRLAVSLSAEIRSPAGHQLRSDFPGLFAGARLLAGALQSDTQINGGGRGGGGARLQLISTGSDISVTKQ